MDRSIANWDDDLYANVHVGGILRTADGGETWTPTIDIDADVHHVTTAEGIVLAAGCRVEPLKTHRLIHPLLMIGVAWCPKSSEGGC
jgi:hypothetical protein